ncbi:MAG: DUF4974 domain-containing protein [Muribaculaceae bacterium]|nr:DUF4974 domain-containing protein [Muribaculaceae bacterium]
MDKTDRLLDAMNNPEKYSSEEIEEMLRDAETKEIFDLLDKTKSSLQPISTPDIDVEWDKFKDNNYYKKKSSVLRLSAFFSRKIAASVTVAIISITAVAAIIGISVSSLNNKENVTSEKEVAATKEIITNREDSIKTTSDSPIQSFETVIFDNEPLEVIMKQIGDFYGYKTEFNSENARSLRLYFRWNQASTIQEIVESLNNFEQIHLTIESETIKID